MPNSGCKGVYFNSRNKKWRAGIKFNNKYIFLGEFVSLQDAIEARKKKDSEFEKIREKEIIGKKFNRLTVLKKTDKQAKNGGYFYECKCNCGNFVLVRLSRLKDQSTKSCGCLFKEYSEILNTRNDYYNGTNIGRIKSRKVAKNNTSGVIGVSYIKKRKKWTASVMLCGKTIHLGNFDRIEDAIKARLKGEADYFQPVIDEYNKTIIKKK